MTGSTATRALSLGDRLQALVLRIRPPDETDCVVVPTGAALVGTNRDGAPRPDRRHATQTRRPGSPDRLLLRVQATGRRQPSLRESRAVLEERLSAAPSCITV